MTAASPDRPTAAATRLTQTVQNWAGVTVHPHPNASLTFRLDRATIGVLRAENTLAVPLPSPIRTVLLDHGLAGPPHEPDVPDWVSLSLGQSEDLAPATRLLRLSYLYRHLLRARDPAALHRIRTELAQHEVPDALRKIYDAMVAKRDAAARSSS